MYKFCRLSIPSSSTHTPSLERFKEFCRREQKEKIYVFDSEYQISSFSISKVVDQSYADKAGLVLRYNKMKSSLIFLQGKK